MPTKSSKKSTSPGAAPTAAPSNEAAPAAPRAPEPDPKETAAAEQSPVAAAAPPTPPAVQKAIDEVMADARARVDAILASEVAQLGTPSANEDEKQARFQRDMLPGRMRKDKTYVPEWIIEDGESTRRQALLYSDYRYALVDVETTGNYLLNGYRLCLFDGGPRSGLAPRGFSGTGDNIFRRTLEGYCQRGDCRLMYIPIRAWELIDEEVRERTAGMVQRTLGNFADAGYSQGIRTFIEAEGKSLT